MPSTSSDCHASEPLRSCCSGPFASANPALSPRMSAVYALLAEAWMQSAEPLTLAQLGQIADGVRFFPRDAALVQQVALLAAARGFPAQAADLAKYGLRIAKTDAQRDQFQLLSAAVARDEQEKKTAPAATPPPPAEPKPSPFAR